MENNKKSKKKWALNCAIGALALLGSVGTITFGTLWCQSRNNTGGDTPSSDPIVINLDEPYIDDRMCYLSKACDRIIPKDQKIALVSKAADATIEGKTSIETFSFAVLSEQYETIPTLYVDCEFYIDDVLIPKDCYTFTTRAIESANLSLLIGLADIPVELDCNNSVFKMIVTPYADLDTTVTFDSMYTFNDL